MPYKGTNLFAQIIALIDRPGFFRTVRTHQAEHGAKGFSCWLTIDNFLGRCRPLGAIVVEESRFPSCAENKKGRPCVFEALRLL
jgi:hypothetical protein